MKEKKDKAYSVSSTQHEYSVVVFAKDRNQAKLHCLGNEWFEDDEYIDLRANRCKWCDYLDLKNGDWVDFCSNSNTTLFFNNSWNCYNTMECEDYFCVYKQEENC